MTQSTQAPRGSRAYVFKGRGKRWLIHSLDFIGCALMRLVTLGNGLVWDPQKAAMAKSILVVRLDHIGDVLFIRPSLAVLRAAFPKARITVLVSSAGQAVLEQEKNIDEILVWDAPWFLRGLRAQATKSFWELRTEIKARRFDLSLDLRGDLRHHILLFLSGVPLRVGYGITGGGFLLHACLPLRVGVHEVERNLDLVHAVCQSLGPAQYLPLQLTPVEKKLGEKLWGPKQSRVVVHAAAGDPRKQWQAEYFSRVCNELAAKKCEVVLVGTSAEKALANQIADRCGNSVRVLAGETSLRQLAALISAADLFVGNDSGPGHLAVTQGIPTIMLWSETNTPEEWGPWGKGVKAYVVRQPNRESAVTEVMQIAVGFLQKPKQTIRVHKVAKKKKNNA